MNIFSNTPLDIGTSIINNYVAKLPIETKKTKYNNMALPDHLKM